MINKDIKDITLTDLLELQRQLDEEVVEPRENGFVPRDRTVLDIRLALDDEFQEWLRELPREYNFKTWKQKEYNREKELEELVDCLFFFLQLFNFYKMYGVDVEFDKFRVGIEKSCLEKEITSFKEHLWDMKWLYGNYELSFYHWIDICRLRGFTKEDIIQTYINKWEKNIGRIKGDWNE